MTLNDLIESEIFLGVSLTLCCVFFTIWWLGLYEEIRVLHHPNHPVWKRVQFSDTFLSGYRPPFYLGLGTKMFCGSIHTILHTFSRTLHKQPVVDYHRELVTLSDGGTVGLDWAISAIDPNSSTVYRSPDVSDPSFPIVFIHHGLCGCSKSQYVLMIVNKLLKLQKFRVVVLVARGCGNIELTTPESFIAARTLDMREALLKIFAQYPSSPVYGIGFSLGAGLMTNYIGEEGKNCKLKGAIVISTCWDFLCRSPWFKFWSKFMLAKFLIDYTKKNLKQLRKNKFVNLEPALDANCVEEFDTHAVVPMFGFKNVKEYYRKSSPLKVAKDIHIPTLALNSDDDPVCSVVGCPTTVDQLGPGLVILRTKQGGHLGWASSWDSHTSWMDQVILDWTEACHSYTGTLAMQRNHELEKYIATRLKRVQHLQDSPATSTMMRDFRGELDSNSSELNENRTLLEIRELEDAESLTPSLVAKQRALRLEVSKDVYKLGASTIAATVGYKVLKLMYSKQ